MPFLVGSVPFQGVAGPEKFLWLNNKSGCAFLRNRNRKFSLVKQQEWVSSGSDSTPLLFFLKRMVRMRKLKLQHKWNPNPPCRFFSRRRKKKAIRTVPKVLFPSFQRALYSHQGRALDWEKKRGRKNTNLVGRINIDSSIFQDEPISFPIFVFCHLKQISFFDSRSFYFFCGQF